MYFGRQTRNNDILATTPVVPPSRTGLHLVKTFWIILRDMLYFTCSNSAQKEIPMQLDSADFSRNADAQQAQTLCDDLDVRAQTMEREQEILTQLVSTNELRRPYHATRYRIMLNDLHTRFTQLRSVIARYCR